MYSHEKELIQSGYRQIAGIDEAGRGPLAGPVVAAAVILPDQRIDGLKDSKKLSEKKREKLFGELLVNAHIGVGIVSHKLIDDINIYKASKLAMVRAVSDLLQKPDVLLIDGKNMNLPVSVPQRSIIKGDTLSASIAAASIVAKVTRDRMMMLYHKQFPEYNFAKHKAYPTKEHLEAIEKYGPSKIHRLSFKPIRKTATL